MVFIPDSKTCGGDVIVESDQLNYWDDLRTDMMQRVYTRRKCSGARLGEYFRQFLIGEICSHVYLMTLIDALIPDISRFRRSILPYIWTGKIRVPSDDR